MKYMRNKTAEYDFCIIVPVYNEEENTPRIESELAAYIKKASLKTCVLFVNDGSSDGSLLRIKEMCKRNSAFYYIGFTRNNGLSAALKAGIDFTESPFVGYIDADLQTSPEDFELLIPHINNYELVTGIRAGRKDTFGKRLSSLIANSFRRMITHDGVEDTGCPLKVLQTETARRIPLFTGMHRFLPALVQLQEGKVRQIPVRHFDRLAGSSKFYLWNRLIGPFTDCFAYLWMKKRYIHYIIESENILN